MKNEHMGKVPRASQRVGNGANETLGLDEVELELVEGLLLRRLAERTLGGIAHAAVHDILSARRLRDRYQTEYRRVLMSAVEFVGERPTDTLQ